MRSSVSIALFFLLSGLFLSVLLGAIERSRKLLAIAAGLLVVVVCIIVFLTPVRLPSNLVFWDDGDDGVEAAATTTSVTLPDDLATTSTVAPRPTTSTAAPTPATTTAVPTTKPGFTITTSGSAVTIGGPIDGRY